ncbi:TEL2-interacting protein 1 [Mortierella sp. GBA30]|nr:TEL2-interacting protein 1 [Mortierella sp. GBA30]
MQQGVSTETLVVFRQVWEPAATVISLSSITASNARETTTILETIHSALESMRHPELHLTEPIIGQIHKALVRVLSLCTGFFSPEKRFDFLMDAWCKCLGFLLQLTDGYELILASDWRYDLHLLNVLLRIVLGYDRTSVQQNIDPTTTPKDRMADETRLLAVQCLIHAIPLSKNAPTIQDVAHQSIHSSSGLSIPSRLRTKSDEWVRDHLLGSDPPTRSTFASLICILSDTIKNAQLVALRLAALDGIMKLLRCLETPQRIGNIYPALVPRLDVAARERGLKEHHSVLTKMLEIWTFVVVESLKDITPMQQDLNSTGVGLSEDLMKMYNSNKKTATAGTTETVPRESAPMAFGSEGWMNEMGKGLRLHFKDISQLRMHNHWMVRFSFGVMAYRILKECRPSLKRLGGTTTTGVAGFLLETLIGCTLDDYEDVHKPAREYLRQLTQEHESTELMNIGKDIMRERLLAMPRVLHGADETVKQNSVRLIQGMVLFLGKQMEYLINHQTLRSYVQPWISLLTIEQLDQYNMDERGGILDQGSSHSRDVDPESDESKWISWIQSCKGSGRKFGFPRKIHLYLREQATSSAFIGLLRQLGSTTEVDVWTEELTARLRQDCQSVRENQGWFDARTVSCVLLLNQVLLGASGIGLATLGEKPMTDPSQKPSAKRKKQRHVSRAAKGVLEEYLDILIETSQRSLEARSKQAAHQRSSSSSTVGTENDSYNRKALLARMIGMNDEDMADMEPGSESTIYDYNMDIMLQCLVLEGIASIAVILGGDGFEMELYRALYILLEHLGDQDSDLVRDTAEASLEHVAFVCRYESIGELVQANYDYVIQQVSQRIAFLSTNPKTPQVLCALIRVVGPPAISMLEDSVTEIFEALDHWKNQEDQVGEGLLKSLCEIVNVMALDAKDAKEPSRPGDHTNKNSSPKRDSGILMMMPDMEFSLPANGSKEVAEFARKYRILVQDVGENSQVEADALEEDMKNMTPDQIRDYFQKLTKDAKEEGSTLAGETPEDSIEDLLSKATVDGVDDSVSMDGLRDAIPKPSQKEPKPVPPTKHQELCLRILEKAGYFLTSNSPRMRILALEAIQRAIIVVKDRPTELHPAIHAFWPAMVSRVLMRRSSESEVFFVSLRAIEVITVLAENCGDFLSRHLLNDIWPFILKALQSWCQRPSVSDAVNRRIQGTAAARGQREERGHKTGSPSPRTQGRRDASTKVFTREHRLQVTTLESLAEIVRNVPIPVKEMWPMLLLAREMMLDRYWTLHWDVRVKAAEVIKSMAIAGHGDSVYLVMDEVVQQSESNRPERQIVSDQEERRDEDEKEDEGAKMCLDILAFMDTYQDQASASAGHIQFTTAELKDTMRPSQSSLPAPAVIRGNAARRTPFSQQHHSSLAQRHARSDQSQTGQQYRRATIPMPSPSHPEWDVVSQLSENITSTSASSSTSQLSSPASTQSAQSSKKKKHRHKKKKKHLPVTSPFHDIAGSSQTQKPKATTTSQQQRRTTQEEWRKTQECLDGDDDDVEKESKDNREPKDTVVEEKTVTTLVSTTTSTTELSDPSDALTAGTAESALSPVLEGSAIINTADGTEEADISMTWKIPTSSEITSYSQIECGQRMPDSQSMSSTESPLASFSLGFDEQDLYSEEPDQRLDGEVMEYASYQDALITEDSIREGSVSVNLTSVEQQEIAVDSTIAADGYRKEVSPTLDWEPDESHYEIQLSLQSIRSSNGSDSTPDPDSRSTNDLKHITDDAASTSEERSQYTDPLPMTGLHHTHDLGHNQGIVCHPEEDRNKAASESNLPEVSESRSKQSRKLMVGETEEAQRMPSRSSRVRSSLTPDLQTGTVSRVSDERSVIPMEEELVMVSSGEVKEEKKSTAPEGSRSSERRRSSERLVEVVIPAFHPKTRDGRHTSKESPAKPKPLPYVEVPAVSTKTNPKVERAHTLKDEDEAEYIDSDSTDSDSVELGRIRMRPTSEKPTRRQPPRKARESVERQDSSLIDSPARHTRSTRYSMERDQEVMDHPSRHTRSSSRHSMERDQGVVDSPSKRMRLRSRSIESRSSPSLQPVPRTLKSTRQRTPTSASTTKLSEFSFIDHDRYELSDEQAYAMDDAQVRNNHDNERRGEFSARQIDADDSHDRPTFSRKRRRRMPSPVPVPSTLANDISNSAKTDSGVVGHASLTAVVRSGPAKDESAGQSGLQQAESTESALQEDDLSALEQDAGALQEKGILGDDDLDVKRLKRLWQQHNISWPLRDRRIESEARKKGTLQFVVEPYSTNFVFGTALPLPKSAKLRSFGGDPSP